MESKILEDIFRAWPMEELENVLTQQMASVDGSGQLFKPYIPLIGKRYDEYRILVYGTAQNMSKDAEGVPYKYYIENPEHLVDRLYWDSSFTKRYEDGNLRHDDVMIGPYKRGVIPALIGLLIKARELSGIDLQLDNYVHIMDASSVSNYYKFSLYAGGRDLNPELIFSKEDAGRVEIEKYHRFNDALVKEEICFLKPRYIMAFKGRKIDVLEKLRGDEDVQRAYEGSEWMSIGNRPVPYVILPINDPSWILRGGGGCLKESGSWGKAIGAMNNEPVEALIEYYLEKLEEKYRGKSESVKIYLSYYYESWARGGLMR